MGGSSPVQADQSMITRGRLSRAATSSGASSPHALPAGRSLALSRFGPRALVKAWQAVSKRPGLAERGSVRSPSQTSSCQCPDAASQSRSGANSDYSLAHAALSHNLRLGKTLVRTLLSGAIH
jgi:hypothetical protein